MPSDALDEIAGDLYWRVFRRIYPAVYTLADGPSLSVQSRAQAVLSSLSQSSLPAIVRQGRRAPDIERSQDADDPWLSSVLNLCRGLALGPKAPSAVAKLVERITLLKRVSLFEKMLSCDLLPIAQACDEDEFEQGQTIFERGDLGERLYVLIDGRVDVVVSGQVVNTLAGGEVFGEVAVLGACPRTASIVCGEPARCLSLSAQRFKKIVAQDGEIGLAVIQVLSGRLQGATQREERLLKMPERRNKQQNNKQ